MLYSLSGFCRPFDITMYGTILFYSSYVCVPITFQANLKLIPSSSGSCSFDNVNPIEIMTLFREFASIQLYFEIRTKHALRSSG